MAESTQQVSGSSHSEQAAKSKSSSEQTAEVKARREKINKNQAEKHKDLKRVVEKDRDISDFSNSSRVKISRALTNFLSESHPKEITHALVENALNSKAPQEKPQKGEQASEPTSDPFFNRLANLQNAELPTARDNLQGYTNIKPSTRKIDVYG
jgi:hypothetical protein